MSIITEVVTRADETINSINTEVVTRTDETRVLIPWLFSYRRNKSINTVVVTLSKQEY